MPRFEMTARERVYAKIFIVVFLVVGSAYVGEMFRPFGVADRVITYAATQVDAEAKRVATQNHKEQEKKPAPKPRPTSGGTYIVQKGDTVHSLSKRFQVDPMTRKWANQIAEANHIEAGQRLVIPR
ncbi:LysM peptidoglycan-binding domain-containing protein [Candidatus Kaiserbacteria bacterium]|nr:LysM peptidoglycan-binding domain-containing protein [Candidatus Kaiserbacteria bacterium]MCB9812206.1 LysM peptidoglycan-binding domain-containing protein [Candidatus Nomurabacteria bacterium]